ncbi:hypothetical protein BDZ91DRAFT_725012, partial [Kalaharituber pfeilii]
MEQTTTADSKVQGLDEEALSHLIDHIFLPEKLPQDGEVNSVQNEFALLLFVKNAVEDFASSLKTEATTAQVAQVVNMMKKMVTLHNANMTLEKETLRTVFKEMKDGDIVPLYIQAQNAGLIIRHTGEEVTFESFEVSPKNESVIECQGRLLCSYPGPIIAIPFTTFHNVAFLNELTVLLEVMSEELPTDRPRPTTAKARTKVTEIRDTVMPIYITEFLTGLLRGVGRVALDRKRICKRIADEVLWKNAHIPWRRSPLWLVTRVALQTTLFDGTLGVKEGMRNREYKFVMLFIMAKVLSAATQINNMLGEKLSHMCRKLSRRAAKLGEDMPATLLALVNETVHVAGTVLTNRFREIQDNSVRKLQWPPVAGLDVEADTNLTMLNSQAYIKNVLHEYKHPLTSSAAIGFNSKHAERICHQYYSASTLPNKSVLSASEADLRTAVKDIETWVESSLEGFITTNITRENACRELYSFLTPYVNAAKKDYEGNPLDMSLMLLTTMEIWVAIDRIATATCPLLREYSCEMTTDMLSLLLLPTRSHIDRLNKLESYIIDRQTNLNRNTVFEDGTNITSSSFAVRYYNQSPEHRLLLAEITEKASRTREEKKAELVRLKQQYDDLMARAGRLEHRCWRHYYYCEKCSLESQARNVSIDVHEWPLPSIDLEARAVVVELKLPVAFGAWRDATYEVLVNILNPFMEKELHDSKHSLQDYQGLSPYFRSQSQNISWASETKSFRRAHYGTRNVSMVLSESDYLVPNGLKYRLAKGSVGASQWITEALTAAKATQVQNVRKLCTFQLPNASAALQYALNSTDHTSNFSIANQHHCPTEWSLHEYDSFTTLRAGYRLQWLNILREIRAGNLNLNRAETNLLFMQTIWQAGPPETPVTHTRESHSNLRDKDFCSLMLDTLTSTLHIIKENWLEQISMQNLIELGARLLCLTPFPEIKGLAAKFLRECRNVCMDWMQDMIKRMNSANSDASFEKWQHLALTMAATCRLTFNVDLTDINFVITSEDDFTSFIQCAACVHENTPPNIRKHPDRLLLDRDTRLAHRMEPYLRKLITENEGWLDTAIKTHWPEYTAGERWKLLTSPNERWITTTTKGGTDRLPMKVHYNLLEGTFLVDGLPFGRLPKEYVSHPDYFRLFQNRIFSVNKANMPGMSFQMAHPVSPANEDLQVYFAMRQGNLIIRTKLESEVHEIIPHSKLEGDFPHTMLNSFVHFLHLTDQRLEFRPLEDSTSLWLSISKDHPNWRAEGTIGMLRLIDYHSPTTQAMNQLFKSIESPSHLELTLTSNQTVNVKLARYNLDFEFNGTNIQESHIKCHVRPTNFLVLREAASTLNSAVRIVIIPHGKIVTDNLDTVNYHLYTVDTLLGCLIYLHALTAYCLTGTEQALDSLRSANADTALGPSEFELLSGISKLTMQQIEWQETVNSILQHWELSKEQNSTSIRGAAYQPSEYGGNEYIARELTDETMEGRVCQISSLVNNWMNLASYLHKWQTISSKTNPSSSIGYRHYWHSSRMEKDWYSLSKSHDQYKILFVLATLSYRGEDDVPMELIETILAFATHRVFAIMNPPDLPNTKTEYRLDDIRQIVSHEEYRLSQNDGESDHEHWNRHHINNAWVCESLSPPAPLTPLNERFAHWVQVELDTIRPLSHHFNTLQDLLSSNEPSTQHPNIRDSVSHLITRFSNDATGFKNRYAQDLEQSWKSLLKHDSSSQQTSQVILCPLECGEGFIGIWRHIKGTIEELLYRTGLLSQLAMRNHHQHTERAQLWGRVLVSFGKTISLYQQAIRLYHHAQRDDSVEFNKEWANKGREGWDPLEYPDWLLFEIENNMLIRPVQAQIASKMLSPPNGTNAVMQLNMGEGKSSVIVPIVAAALADKKKLVRVVVLKPLSGQMFHLLVQKLSGLLNRRIYYLPFHRQIELTESTVNLIQELYQECLDNGGILLSQPEHLLSFKLMGVEKLSAGGPIADSLLRSQRWLENHSRDILDESDEVLHVRYQLIYTIGEQHAPQLSPDRWVIIQELFGLVSKHMRELKGRYPDGVEVMEREDAPGSFPFTRLLKKEPESELLDRIAEDVIRRGVLGAVSTRWFTDCMSNSLLYLIRKKNVQGPTKWPEVGDMLPYFLLLRGMIAHGILAFVLREKRWRVDYGLAPHRTLLAVPYRAKDSPAPRADFGHPDVTIALTCLSYYYQGLDDGQLRMCFERLKKLDNPAAEYLTWIKGCEDLPSPLRQLQGINLEDNDQWSYTIYPRLRLNKSVIDFYLTSIEFPAKLTTSGWDLAEEKRGTNDNRYLLPVSIEQLDLPEQTHTNAKPENNHYTCAQKEGNERLPTDKIQVLLDVGAQVLEMKNHEVAECWLKLASEGNHQWTAAVFFNDDDELTPYMISPYVKNMTTGTDLKLPAESIAAVTLGPKLTKDRLVQACMRMRKLGQGQSVHRGGAHIETIDIISWVMHETCTQTERSVALWASQGIGHQIREHAWSKYKASKLDGDMLAKEWEEPESRTLEYMYGISNQQRESVKHIIATKLQEPDLRPRYKQFDIINSRCEEYQVVSLHGVAMQEEQEREVAHEVEIEAFIKTGIVNPSSFSSSFRYLMDTLSQTSFHKDIEPGPWAQNIIATVDFAETVKLNQSNHKHMDDYLRPVTWIVSSVRHLDTSPVLCLLSSFEVNELLPHIRRSQFVNLHMYTPKAQRIAPTFEDLTYAAIPALPNGWAASFPSRDQLMIQVNLFAGQLFFKSFTAYTRTCGFLGIFLRGREGGIARKNDGNGGPGVLNGEVAFEESPLRFVRTLIGVRRKGMKFGVTHAGLL